VIHVIRGDSHPVDEYGSRFSGHRSPASVG
jgi:hypothetical protein